MGWLVVCACVQGGDREGGMTACRSAHFIIELMKRTNLQWTDSRTLCRCSNEAEVLLQEIGRLHTITLAAFLHTERSSGWFAHSYNNNKNVIFEIKAAI